MTTAEKRRAYWREWGRKNRAKRSEQNKRYREKRKASGNPLTVKKYRQNPIIKRLARSLSCGIHEARQKLIELYERRPELRDKDAEYLARLGHPPDPLAFRFLVPAAPEHETGKNDE